MRAPPLESLRAPDVVVLVPGFLAFARFGGFYYFADRVVAALSAIFAERLRRQVPVIPFASLPTSGLRDRQGALRGYLNGLCSGNKKLAGIERVHLIGHSTGGVDAQLLASATTLDGQPWDPEKDAFLGKIGSVVTVSSPHHGTRLSESELARVGTNPVTDPSALLSQGGVALHLLLLAFRDRPGLAGVNLARWNEVGRFLWDIVRDRQLITDLRPDRMSAVRDRTEPDPRVRLTCFATGTVPRDDDKDSSEPFFRDLYSMTARGNGPPPPIDFEPALQALRGWMGGHPERIIRSPTSLLPEPLVAAVNDGAVNSASQIVDPTREDQFGGFVVADHADVLGHYDRVDELVDGEPLNAGLFHSGAGFRDGQFFELYRRVAEAVLAAIPG